MFGDGGPDRVLEERGKNRAFGNNNDEEKCVWDSAPGVSFTVQIGTEMVHRLSSCRNIMFGFLEGMVSCLCLFQQ